MSISVRRYVQFTFLMIVVAIGILFYQFVVQLESGVIPPFERPPGVEAFLPIGALVSLKYFIYTGIINKIHPAALILFVIICTTAIIAKKGFCSWICPFGLLSDILSNLNTRLLKNRISLQKWLDGLLRSVKYIITLFFIYAIFFKMPIKSIEQFILSPYNRFSDIKMLQFFTHISTTALIVVLILFVLTFVVRHFWCRYLCPYGAIIGILGFLSIGKIKRDASHCTNCGKCEAKCPGLINIRQKDSIDSSECTACMNCVSTCPEKRALGFYFFSKLRIQPYVLGMLFIGLFTIGITAAKITGNWQSEISKKDYLIYLMKMKAEKIQWGKRDL